MQIIVWKNGAPPYLTRDGRRAVIFESYRSAATGEALWQGWVEGMWCEWRLDGTALGDDRGLDLVGEGSR